MKLASTTAWHTRKHRKAISITPSASAWYRTITINRHAPKSSTPSFRLPCSNVRELLRCAALQLPKGAPPPLKLGQRGGQLSLPRSGSQVR